MSEPRWENLHQLYAEQDWAQRPSLFAETCVPYFPSDAQLLELGAGLGQDTLFFARNGFHVTATDLSTGALSQRLANQDNIQVAQLDMREPLLYGDETFDVIYAHLSVHYFDEATTRDLFSEIYRVLGPGGILAFLVNSTSDPEYGTGDSLGQDFYLIDGVKKRYFSQKTAEAWTARFEAVLCDTHGETYKDRQKGVHQLVRYIGRKPLAAI